jgi:hypothetical protein
VKEADIDFEIFCRIFKSRGVYTRIKLKKKIIINLKNKNLFKKSTDFKQAFYFDRHGQVRPHIGRSSDGFYH